MFAVMKIEFSESYFILSMLTSWILILIGDLHAGSLQCFWEIDFLSLFFLL